MAVPWSEARVYPVRLGDSFNKRRAASLHALQYAFKPASLESGAHGDIEVSGATVTVEATPAAAGGAPVQFKGSWAEAKEGECVLIWEDGAFRLEKLATAAKALRPVASAQRATKRPRTPGQRSGATKKKAAAAAEGEGEGEGEELDEARVDAELEDLLAAD